MIIIFILGLRSVSEETVREKTQGKKDEVYFRLDTLEMKVPREGAWATPGASLSQALTVGGKKVFDL